MVQFAHGKVLHIICQQLQLLPQISSWKFLKKYHHRLLKIVPFETIFTFSTHAPKVYFAQSYIIQFYGA